MKPKDVENRLQTVRILKIASCLTLSGKSKLTYHIGLRDEADVQFRIYASSGGGFYSNEWVASKAIEQALGKETLVTARSLHPIFKGKSANTAGFLLAVLKQERLIVRSTESPRKYLRTESEAFVAEVQGLIESTVGLDPKSASHKTSASSGTAPSGTRQSISKAAKQKS